MKRGIPKWRYVIIVLVTEEEADPKWDANRAFLILLRSGGSKIASAVAVAT